MRSGKERNFTKEWDKLQQPLKECAYLSHLANICSFVTKRQNQKGEGWHDTMLTLKLAYATVCIRRPTLWRDGGL